MKKIYTMLLAGLALCAVSCQEGPIDQPEVDTPETGETMTFTASFGEPSAPSLAGTKVALDGLQPKWEAGDAITIYSSNGHKIVFTTQDSGLTATFTAANVPADFNAPYYAVYGRQADKSNLYNGDIQNIQLWKDQTIGDHKTAPMVAHSQNTVLNFKNLGALLKFTVNAENVTSVKLVTDARITGEGSCNSDGVYSIYDNDEEGFREVILRGTFESGKTYHIVVAPTTIHSLKMYVNDQLYRSVENTSIDILRNNEFDLQSVDGAIVYLQKTNWGYNEHNRRTNEICLNPGSNAEEYIHEAAYSDNGLEGQNGSKWYIYKPGIVGSTMNIRFGTQWSSEKNSNTIEVTFKPIMYFYVDQPEKWDGWTPMPFDAHNVNF